MGEKTSSSPSLTGTSLSYYLCLPGLYLQQAHDFFPLPSSVKPNDPIGTILHTCSCFLARTLGDQWLNCTPSFRDTSFVIIVYSHETNLPFRHSALFNLKLIFSKMADIRAEKGHHAVVLGHHREYMKGYVVSLTAATNRVEVTL